MENAVLFISECRFFGKGKLARSKSCKLVNHITGCLQKTFAHDTEGFMNKERFDIVMQPLVDQVIFFPFFLIFQFGVSFQYRCLMNGCLLMIN